MNIQCLILFLRIVFHLHHCPHIIHPQLILQPRCPLVEMHEHLCHQHLVLFMAAVAQVPAAIRALIQDQGFYQPLQMLDLMMMLEVGLDLTEMEDLMILVMILVDTEDLVGLVVDPVDLVDLMVDLADLVDPVVDLADLVVDLVILVDLLVDHLDLEDLLDLVDLEDLLDLVDLAVDLHLVDLGQHRIISQETTIQLCSKFLRMQPYCHLTS